MTSLRTRRRLIGRLREQGIQNEQVLRVMEGTPRHLFVDHALSAKSYDDTALPIGQNQTISQPYVVALMTQLLLDSEIEIKKVLEIGTGCGYQTAILSSLVSWIFTVERIGSLLEPTRQRLAALECRNISYLNGDGFLGWDSNKPFDGILVAAAPSEIPQKLVDQLRVGGKMVIPIGNNTIQKIQVVTKTQQGIDVDEKDMVKFVPMLGGSQK